MFKCLLFILFPPVPCNPKEFNPDLDVIFQNFLQLFLHRPYKKMQYKYIMYFIKRLSSWLFNYNQLNLPEQKNSCLLIQFEFRIEFKSESEFELDLNPSLTIIYRCAWDAVSKRVKYLIKQPCRTVPLG